MGKKVTKSGTILAYPIILVGLAIIVAMVAMQFGKIELLENNLSFIKGDENKTLRYIGMGVGALIGIVGFFKMPRKTKSK